MLAAPDFPTPLWQSLRAISQQLIAPGLESIPPETVTVLQTNTRFVNSFMVGANHELARQLVWRHFPTDQRATYFRQFWDASAAVPDSGGALPDLHDILPIDQWNPRTELAEVAGSETADLLVLVVRGELLRRFPNASVFAVPSDGHTPTAAHVPGHRAAIRTPPPPPSSTRASRDGSTQTSTFFGFELTTNRGRQVVLRPPAAPDRTALRAGAGRPEPPSTTSSTTGQRSRGPTSRAATPARSVPAEAPSTRPPLPRPRPSGRRTRRSHLGARRRDDGRDLAPRSVPDRHLRRPAVNPQ